MGVPNTETASRCLLASRTPRSHCLAGPLLNRGARDSTYFGLTASDDYGVASTLIHRISATPGTSAKSEPPTTCLRVPRDIPGRNDLRLSFLGQVST
jgi:hypothetical protein